MGLVSTSINRHFSTWCPFFVRFFPANALAALVLLLVRVKKISLTEKLLIVKQNSPCRHLRECIENGTENMDTDLGV